MLEFEAAAQKALPSAHFGYLASGVDGDRTLAANRNGFDRIYLRPRRLIDVSRTDMKLDLFGTSMDYPFFLCPLGNQKAFHTEGEIAVVRGAKSRNAMFTLSTAASTSIEDASQAFGGPPWYQLYATNKWEITERLIKRVENAGCSVIFVTMDTLAGRYSETQLRSRRMDSRQCIVCHPKDGFYRRTDVRRDRYGWTYDKHSNYDLGRHR